jgi:hypothetical protein
MVSCSYLRVSNKWGTKKLPLHTLLKYDLSNRF